MASQIKLVTRRWVALACEFSDLSGVELAHELGISESRLSKYRRGTIAPPRVVQDGLMKLAGFEHDRYLAGPGGAN